MTTWEREAAAEFLSRMAGSYEELALRGPREDRVMHLTIAEILARMAVTLPGQVERIAANRRSAALATVASEQV